MKRGDRSRDAMRSWTLKEKRYKNKRHCEDEEHSRQPACLLVCKVEASGQSSQSKSESWRLKDRFPSSTAQCAEEQAATVSLEQSLQAQHPASACLELCKVIQYLNRLLKQV